MIHRFFQIFNQVPCHFISVFFSWTWIDWWPPPRPQPFYTCFWGRSPPWWPLPRHITSSLSDGRPSLWAKRRKDRHNENERIKSTKNTNRYYYPFRRGGNFVTVQIKFLRVFNIFFVKFTSYLRVTSSRVKNRSSIGSRFQWNDNFLFFYGKYRLIYIFSVHCILR